VRSSRNGYHAKNVARAADRVGRCGDGGACRFPVPGPQGLGEQHVGLVEQVAAGGHEGVRL
jgi:hypothetical protein